MGESGELARIFADQDGVITTVQALGCDLTRSEIHGRVAREEWQPVARGVYRLQSHAYTEHAMVRAAALAWRGVLDRTTAAWWHGLLEHLPQPLTLSVRHAVREDPWEHGAADVVRRRFCAEDLTQVRGVDVTAKELTVLGCAGLVEDQSRFLDRVLQRGEVTLTGLQACLERNPRARGMTSARKLVAVLDSDTESAAERLFIQLLRAENISGWVQQYPFQGWFVDVAWPDWKVAVEIDGWAFHRDHKSFRRDASKRNALVRAGWLPLSFTWHDVHDEPAATTETLTAVLVDRALAAG